MSFEEILEAEYGKGKVYIDYLEEDSKNMANIRIISRDSKKEFRAEAILTENTIEIAKRIKDNIENHTIHYNNNIIKMTASFGIALKNKHSSNFKDFIKLGDINLYEAKQNGRNKIVF